MTPEAAVVKLTEIVIAQHEFSEDDVYAAMATAAIPDAIADRAYKFTQTAWGRALFDGLGVRFSSTYLCFNAAGEVVETGRLEEEPHFVAAMAMAHRHAAWVGFQRLALMSAEVQAINQALHNGVQADALVTAPVGLFLAVPTEAGREKARHVMAAHMAVLPQAPPRQKPWWRFW